MKLSYMWLIGFVGGISLGVILSARDLNVPIPIQYVIYLILAIIMLLVIMVDDIIK